MALALTMSWALTAQTSATISADYELLLSISEPARFDLYDRNVHPEGNKAVPIALPIHAEIDFSHPLPALIDPARMSITEHLQLATAFRLRGDYSSAVPHYSSVVKASKQPIHAFFYAQSLRATGQELLADLYSTRYNEGVGGSLEAKSLSEANRSGIPAAIYGQVTNELYGNAVPNVEVRLVNICTEEEFVTSTDSNGEFRFNDHPADCAFVVRFKKRFFEGVLVEAAAPEGNERVDIELEAVQDLSFR